MNSEIYDRLRRITEEEQELLRGREGIDKGRYSSTEKLIIDRHKLLEEGRLIQIRPHTRFVHFPEHTHNYVEAIYMCSGETTHLIDGERVVLKQGELLFLSKSAVQEILPAGEEDVAVNFIILPEFFDQALYMIGAEENLVRKFLVGCLQDEGEGIHYLHFKVADVLPVQNLVENLLWTLLHDQPGRRSVNQFTMGLLFLQLIHATDKVEVGNRYGEQELLLSVYRYVEESYREGELSGLAQRLGYDLPWLSRRIKRLTGQTYTGLVQDKRLRQAQYLLETTSLSVAEIGGAVGYDNLSYFHRIFREKYHMSPRQWRECK